MHDILQMELNHPTAVFVEVSFVITLKQQKINQTCKMRDIKRADGIVDFPSLKTPSEWSQTKTKKRRTPMGFR